MLGRPPILGLTATATPAIADDVLVQLGMKDAKVCRVSFHRPNLAFDVRKVAGEADKLRQLGKLIQRLRRPGIVYCATVARSTSSTWRFATARSRSSATTAR